MTTSDPIRLSDFREAQAAAPAFSRQEAERQFKLSLALVTMLALGTAVAVVTLPTVGSDSTHQAMQVAASPALAR